MKKQNEKSQWQQFNVTFYSYRSNSENFIECVKEAMENVIEDVEETEENHFKITLFDGSPVFCNVHGDAEYVQQQINGMTGFFMQAPVENKDVKYAAIKQIQLFKYISSVTLFFDDNKDRTQGLYSFLFHIAELAGAYMLTGDMRLIDSENRTLIGKDGSTDFDEYYPMSDKSVVPQIKEDECDKERWERSLAVLRKLGLPYIEQKEVSIAENDCEIKSKEDIIHRLACVFTASACADTCINSPEDAPNDVVNFRNLFEKNFNISQYVSNYEKRYIDDPFNHDKYHSTHTWRYECCYVMLWALGLVDADLPSQCCDAGEICNLMFHTNFDDLCAKANMRSKEEILDKLDLVYRINWACVEARIKHQEVNVVDPTVTYFWHYALNWIAGVDGIKDWDKIQPNT